MRLTAARTYALSLPEAAEAPHHEYSSYRVRGRIFATVPPDGAHLHVFPDERSREEALVRHSDFVEKLIWGKKVVGLRLTLAEANPAVVKRLLREAWIHRAPKRLVAERERRTKRGQQRSG